MSFFSTMLLLLTIVVTLRFLNWFSYSYLKTKVLLRKKWDLNICSGKTDGGGVNADKYKVAELPNFHLIKSIYKLPFKNNQFKTVLCSHTMEHVEDPKAFFKELQRVGQDITILVPPLWDIGAVINVLEHKWIFLTFKTEHTSLPTFVPLPFSNFFHKHLGQRIHA